VRENAESIAFYGGEAGEAKLLFQRLGDVVANYMQLLITSRNLSFFTSFYRQARMTAAAQKRMFQRSVDLVSKVGPTPSSLWAGNPNLEDVLMAQYRALLLYASFDRS
jgi:ABC-type uncharacterized transport system fused permease/ATPase subunit